MSAILQDAVSIIMISRFINPPKAFGEPVFDAVLKQSPADFHVEEVMDIAFSGDGEHLYLRIEKTGMNTDEVVEILQRAYQVESADLGLSGLKDRHAVSTQWFSIRTPMDAVVAERAFDESGLTNSTSKQVRLVRSERHQRKLRRGAHKANQFVVILRNVQSVIADDALPDEVARRINQIIECGFPNYIGPQRFGFDQQNFHRALQWFRQPRKRVSRQRRGLWLSAARSAIFNEVCAARVSEGNWQRLLAGEPAVLHGSRSFFVPSPEELASSDMALRLSAFDVHPSAPWWGRGRALSSGQCEIWEAQVMRNCAPVCEGLERAGLEQERRALRACALDLEHQWLDTQTLVLSFALSPGVFATTLLGEIGRCVEPSRIHPV